MDMRGDRAVVLFVCIGLLALLTGCGGGGGSSATAAAPPPQAAPQEAPVPLLSYTWISGANTIDQQGTYGVKGTADPANVPGARRGAVSWVDGSDNLWLFGGQGRDSIAAFGSLNDLWKFNGTNWTWVSGANTWGQQGTYGVKGIAAPGNVPGARQGAISWVDGSGNLWLFGGNGYDSAGASDLLNDLWKFDGTNWTWVSGADTVNQNGAYGVQGVAAPANVPGARQYAVSWIDGSGNLWLFGGSGRDSMGVQSLLNDLWKFDGTNWTWVSGANIAFRPGVYGVKGAADPANVPGARQYAVSWIDGSGNLWLFGGFGRDSGVATGPLNDLWKFDGTNWTWVSGADTVNQQGAYGVKGVAAPGNVPGARYGSVSWIDSSGNLLLFGGYGRDSVGATGLLNDLWKFDGANWTWVSGANTWGQKGTYGVKGAADPANVPGARSFPVSWIDGSGNLWLFGGFGYDSAGLLESNLNDLWRYW